MYTKKLSVIVPFYNEQGNILPLFREISNSIATDFVGWDYEIIMINDGSKDATRSEIQECKKLDSHVMGICFQKNYGQSIALHEGFIKAQGDIVVTLDGDGQNNPKDIKRLYDKMIADNLDVVAGRRKKRKDPLWMRIITRIARGLRDFIIKDGVHDSGCTLRVYKKDPVKNLYLRGEMHRYIMAITKINGFATGELQVDHRPRGFGVSKYNRKKSIKGFIDLMYIRFVRKYQSRPMHLFGFLGLVSSFFGFGMVLIALIQRIIRKYDFSDNGYTLLGVFLGITGMLMFIFGLIIDMLIRLHFQHSQEARYLVKETI